MPSQIPTGQKLKEAMELAQKVAATIPGSLRKLMPVCDRFPTSKDKPMREVILYQTEYCYVNEVEKLVANTATWEAVSDDDWDRLKRYCERNNIRIIERKRLMDTMISVHEAINEQTKRDAEHAKKEAIAAEKRKAKELERKRKQLAKLQAELGNQETKQ